MWRRNRFPGNQDSDDSISDEEEFELGCSEHCVSLDGPSKKEEPDLALQFDLLRGAIEANEKRKHTLAEKVAGFSSEDEVEMPIFHDKGDGEKNNDEYDSFGSVSVASWSEMHKKLISSGKVKRGLSVSMVCGAKLSKQIDLPNTGHEKQLEDCMRSVVNRGRDRFAQLSDNADTFLEQPAKFDFVEGGKVGNQPNSLHIQSCNEQVVRHSTPAKEDLDSPEPPLLDESLLPIQYKSLEAATADCVEGFQGKFIGESSDASTAEGTSGHVYSKHSMADLLDGLQEKDCGQYAIPKMVIRRGKRGRVGVNRSTSVKEKRVVNDEDPCENIDSGSSSDDEAKVQSQVPTTTETERKTLADQFREALGASSVNEGTLLVMPKQSSGGLLGKLQKVIQREKELDLEFSKNQHSEGLTDEAGYIDVKILSRSFEAKLTVCLCSVHGYNKSFVLTKKSEEESLMNTRTIIFNSRACGDVELDAGNFIRIYPPWREVQVLEGGNIIILALYFTHIST